MNGAVAELRAAGVPTRHACALTATAPATFYRHHPHQGGDASAPPSDPDPDPDPDPDSDSDSDSDVDVDVETVQVGVGEEVPAGRQALSTAERAAVLDLLSDPAYTDLSIGQVWARELDEGRHLASLSTTYRIARAAGLTTERRRLATHPPRVIPELAADGPSQVWTWDITKLRGPVKGCWYHLYVLIDVFSRYTPHYLLAAAEDSFLAADFITEAITLNGGAPHTIHADRGTSMTSKTVATLLSDLAITRSHSRPRVSNDNPYSEAQFKTLKYVDDFPSHFASLGDAREFCEGFFTEYNHIHRHSGIAWHTPASVHFGTYTGVDDARQATLDAAFAANPARYSRRPRTPALPQQVWINQPTTTETTTPTN